MTTITAPAKASATSVGVAAQAIDLRKVDGAEEAEVRALDGVTVEFDGFAITREADGTTVLRGSVFNQSALHGLLPHLRDIGIPLTSLTPVEPTAHERPAPEPEGN